MGMRCLPTVSSVRDTPHIPHLETSRRESDPHPIRSDSSDLKNAVLSVLYLFLPFPLRRNSRARI